MAARLGRVQPRRPPGAASAGFGLRRGERFTYEYNFFAGWRHDIRVEEILPRSPRRRYPACTGGARQAPPEHCGSPEEFLALRQRWPPVLIAARMAEILADLLDADGDAPAGEAIGDHRDELARLLDLARLDKLDRAALNSALHALEHHPRVRQRREAAVKITVQIVIDAQDGTPPAVEQVAAIARDDLTMASAGLALAEAHEVLSGIQHHLVTAQATAAAVARRPCGNCGRPRGRKDTRHIVLRTLFGTLRLESPRYKACPCAASGPATVSPVAALLPERTAPELLLWEAKYAALTSYGAAATPLSEAFPLGRTLQPTAVRQQVESTAARLEDELGEERFSFIDTCPAEWEELPRPGLPLVVTLDGGYVHSSRQSSRKVAGSRLSPAPAPPAAAAPPRPSPMSRPTTPSPSADCTNCCARRGCRTTSKSSSSPTAARTSVTCPATSTPRPSTTSTGSTSPCA